MRERLRVWEGAVGVCFLSLVAQQKRIPTYSLEHGAPPSLAIAHSRRLPDVTLPIVPLTKQMAKAQLMTTAAARLPVAWMISSMSGFPVRVVRMASGLGMQKIKTTIIVRPLFES